MIPVIFINGNPHRKRMERATAELEHCVRELAQMPPGTLRELTIVIDTVDLLNCHAVANVLACWAFAERMMELATLHNIKTFAKVYSSVANTTLIALAADHREVKRSGHCELSLGHFKIEVTEIGDAQGLNKELFEQLRRWREDVMALIDIQASWLACIVGFWADEHICLGTTKRDVKAAVHAFFPQA